MGAPKFTPFDYYGPYADLSEAYAAIPVQYRFSAVFGLLNDVAIEEYWWPDSARTANGDEILNVSGGSSDIWDDSAVWNDTLMWND